MLQLDSTESDSQILGAPASWESIIDLFWEVPEDATMGISSSSWTLHGGDSMKVQNFHGWTDCVDMFIRSVKQTNKMHILQVGAAVRPAQFVRQHRLRMSCKWSYWFGYLLDYIFIRLEGLIQVHSCKLVYQTLVFHIGNIYYHSRRVWLQVQLNRHGDEWCSPSSSEILLT
jgi:hypothetical protein